MTLTTDEESVSYPGQVTRVYGPPGTGKTTFLSRYARDVVARNSPEDILISSFSRTAAEEIASRFEGAAAHLRPPARAIGTLHSHALRSIQRPAVALDPEVIADWNSSALSWSITPDSRNGGSEGGKFCADPSLAVSGDELIGCLDRLRATLTPEEDWPENIRVFAKAFTAWKRDAEAVDYTDMIEMARDRARDGEPPPGNPSFMIVDEAQDNTPLEHQLVRFWGLHVERLVLGLDDDQAINRWRGGDARPLLELDGPDVADHLLDKSYRVPEAVRAVAERWVTRLSFRHDKHYLPRTETETRVAQDGSTYEHDTGRVVLGKAYPVPESIKDLTLVDRSIEEVDRGRTVMIIASCNYMLETLIKNLRERGVPFHNPYRPSETRWNPLGVITDGMSTAERVFRYMLPAQEMGEQGRLWTGRDVQAWLELVKLKESGMVGNAKKRASMFDPDAEVSEMDIYALFNDALQRDRAVEPELNWLAENLLANRKQPAAYPIQVARTYGAAALAQRPQIVVGTVHCSPPDEPVLTTEGYVPIGDLDPARHRLASYAHKSNYPTWNMRQDKVRTRLGYGFQKACNPYSGDMLTLRTDRSRTRVTPDHRVRVRFTDAFMDKHVVYLMRRGDWWRIGTCVSGRRPYRSAGVAGRLATEQADAGWILKVCATRREALIFEAQIQSRYGIPGLTFQSAKARALSNEDLRTVHDAVKGEVAPRAKELLADLGYSQECPLYVRAGEGRNDHDLRGAFVTEARNVLSGYMEMPTIRQDFAAREKPIWLPVAVSREHYEGDIYSLEVLPHHYYVSGGAIVHNSVKGAAADIVYVSPDMSAAAGRGLAVRDGKDDVIRTFYVAMTRARQELRILAPTSHQHMSRKLLLPPDLEVT